MKMKKYILTAVLALSSAFAGFAQVAEVEVTEEVYRPNWYIFGQVGGQETLGEAAFGKLAAFNAQIGVGYNFNSVLGLRLAINGLTSKAAMSVYDYSARWKWNYVSPTVDATVDLVNLFGGYDPNRVVSAGILAGIGANVGYNNKHAVAANDYLKGVVFPEVEAANRPDCLQKLWTGTKARFVGRMGAFVDFNVSHNVKIGLELQANVLPDGYNSKKAGNADWYFNGLVGVKYAFGGRTKTVARMVPAPVTESVVTERIVEVPVVKEVIKEVIKEIHAPLSRDVFFKISNSVVSKDEMYKVAEVARFLNENPTAVVTVTGYADKGTGTQAINLRLSAQRANAVAKVLVEKFGIAESRITVKSMGEENYQPYPTPALNRVSIMVAEVK